MKNPVSDETVEFNDNCVSLFVAQRGKCAICKLPLTLENMRCIRKIPKSCGGVINIIIGLLCIQGWKG